MSAALKQYLIKAWNQLQDRTKQKYIQEAARLKALKTAEQSGSSSTGKVGAGNTATIGSTNTIAGSGAIMMVEQQQPSQQPSVRTGVIRQTATAVNRNQPPQQTTVVVSQQPQQQLIQRSGNANNIPQQPNLVQSTDSQSSILSDVLGLALQSSGINSGNVTTASGGAASIGDVMMTAQGGGGIASVASGQQQQQHVPALNVAAPSPMNVVTQEAWEQEQLRLEQGELIHHHNQPLMQQQQIGGSSGIMAVQQGNISRQNSIHSAVISHPHIATTATTTTTKQGRKHEKYVIKDGKMMKQQQQQQGQISQVVMGGSYENTSDASGTLVYTDQSGGASHLHQQVV